MLESHSVTLVLTAVAVTELIGMAMAVDAVMRPRSSQGAIAWFVALVALPVVTVPMCLIFGRTRFSGYAEALRGVDVRVILAAKADLRLVELASYTYYAAMLGCGVRLFRFQGRFMHQKVLLLDDALAAIGTVNLDNRSLYLDFEATALVADNAFAAEVADMLRGDLELSTEVDLEHFESKPLAFRAAARVARLASPLL